MNGYQAYDSIRQAGLVYSPDDEGYYWKETFGDWRTSKVFLKMQDLQLTTSWKHSGLVSRKRLLRIVFRFLNKLNLLIGVENGKPLLKATLQSHQVSQNRR